MKSFVKNATDAEQVKDAKEKVKFSRDQEKEDIKAVLSTVSGRRFVWRYMGLCGLHKISYLGQGCETHTLFLEGMRNVGLALEADIMDACPDKFVMMLTENSLQS